MIIHYISVIVCRQDHTRHSFCQLDVSVDQFGSLLGIIDTVSYAPLHVDSKFFFSGNIPCTNFDQEDNP